MPKARPSSKQHHLDSYDLLLLSKSDQVDTDEIEKIVSASGSSLIIRDGIGWIESTDLKPLIEDLCRKDSGATLSGVVASTTDSPSSLVAKSFKPKSLQALLEENAKPAKKEEQPTDYSKLDFRTRYRPIIELETQLRVGYQANLVANDSKAHFGPTETNGLAHLQGQLAEHDKLVGNAALDGLGPWIGQGLLFIPVNCVDGALELAQARALVARADELGLEQDQIVFEIRISSEIKHLQVLTAQVERLRKYGVRIALSDIGSSHTSVVTTAALAPDIVTIDGSLLQNRTDESSLAALGAMVTMSHQSGAWTLLTDLKTAQQSAAAKSLEIDWASGPLVGQPLKLEAGRL